MDGYQDTSRRQVVSGNTSHMKEERCCEAHWRTGRLMLNISVEPAKGYSEKETVVCQGNGKGLS